jgi:hypothetical protein
MADIPFIRVFESICILSNILALAISIVPISLISKKKKCIAGDGKILTE